MVSLGSIARFLYGPLLGDFPYSGLSLSQMLWSTQKRADRPPPGNEMPYNRFEGSTNPSEQVSTLQLLLNIRSAKCVKCNCCLLPHSNNAISLCSQYRKVPTQICQWEARAAVWKCVGSTVVELPLSRDANVGQAEKLWAMAKMRYGNVWIIL